MGSDRDFGAEHDDELVPVASTGRGGRSETGEEGTGEGRTYTLLSPAEATASMPRRSLQDGGPRDSPWRRPADRDAGPAPRRRSRRSAIPIAAVVVVAVAAAAFAAGRKSSPAAEPGAGQVVTAPHLRDGIPSGFPPDATGAQAAAADYTAMFGEATLQDATTLRASLESMAVAGTDFAAAASAGVQAYRERLDALGLAVNGSTRFRTYPLSVSLGAFGEERAEVDVWAATVIAAEGARPPAIGLVTYHVVLAWTGTDWLLEDVEARPGSDGAHVPSGMDATPLFYEPVPDAGGMP